MTQCHCSRWPPALSRRRPAARERLPHCHKVCVRLIEPKTGRLLRPDPLQRIGLPHLGPDALPPRGQLADRRQVEVPPEGLREGLRDGRRGRQEDVRQGALLAERAPLPDPETMLLVDHDMGLVLSISDYVVVLEFGEVIAHGTPDAVRRDPAVIAAYLGQAGQEVAAELGTDAQGAQ